MQRRLAMASSSSSDYDDSSFAEYLHGTLARIRIAFIQSLWVVPLLSPSS